GQPHDEARAGSRRVCIDVALDAAGDPARKRKSEPGADRAVRAGGASPNSRFEDALPLVVDDARPVVLDDIENARITAYDGDANLPRAVAAGGLDHPLGAPPGTTRVGADPQRVGRPGDLHRDLARLREAGARRSRAGHDALRVGGAAVAAGLVRRRSDERVDRPRELVGALVNRVQRLLVLGRT